MGILFFHQGPTAPLGSHDTAVSQRQRSVSARSIQAASRALAHAARCGWSRRGCVPRAETRLGFSPLPCNRLRAVRFRGSANYAAGPQPPIIKSTNIATRETGTLSRYKNRAGESYSPVSSRRQASLQRQRASVVVFVLRRVLLSQCLWTFRMVCLV